MSLRQVLVGSQASIVHAEQLMQVGFPMLPPELERLGTRLASPAASYVPQSPRDRWAEPNTCSQHPQIGRMLAI